MGRLRPDGECINQPVPVPQAKNILTYYLGEEQGMAHGVDTAWLDLYLDAKGRYIGWRIWQPGIWQP
jgi:hypothetical protein